MVYSQRSCISHQRIIIIYQVSSLNPFWLKFKLEADSSFVPRPFYVKLDTPECSGYVGERIPVIVKIKNDDDRKVYSRLSVFLPPSDDEQGTSVSLS
jgi:hypothetical protein